MRNHGRSTLTQTQVILHILGADFSRFDSDSARWVHWKAAWEPSPKADPNERTEDSPPSVRRPMSAVASEIASPPTPVIAACVELGKEQMQTDALLHELARCLRPVLSQAPAGDNVRGVESPPPHSPLHADMQDRVRRQREINYRLRCLTRRLVG